MLISGMQLRHYSAGGAVGSSALTFKVVYCISFTVNPVRQRQSKGNLPTIRLAPPYSCLITFFISAHTSAERDGAFTDDKNLNPEIIAYAHPFTSFLLGNTTDIAPTLI
jgi:hypothetical protein